VGITDLYLASLCLWIALVAAEISRLVFTYLGWVFHLSKLFNICGLFMDVLLVLTSVV